MFQWEPWLTPVLKEQRGDVFVDVGANVGQWSKALSPRFRRVVACEPNPQALKVLTRDLPANVYIVPQCIWSAHGMLRCTQYRSSAHMSAYGVEPDINTGPKTGELDLPCTTLDLLLQGQEIDGHVSFLKMDIEGAEVEAVKGGERVLRAHRPNLLIEVHSVPNGEWLKETLPQWGFRVREIRHPAYAQGSRFWQMHYWLHGEAA